MNKISYIIMKCKMQISSDYFLFDNNDLKFHQNSDIIIIGTYTRHSVICLKHQ